MFKIASTSLSALAAAMLVGTAAVAAEPSDLREQVESCHEIRDPEQRLACFDRLLETPQASRAEAAPDLERTASRSDINRMNLFWELDDQTHSGRGRIRAYKPLLAAPVRWSSRPNEQPASPSGQAIDAFPLDSVESSLRLSLRTKLWDNPIGDNGDIWFAYTQTAFWQSYNTDESSPFRETNYMPEIFSVWRVGMPLSERWSWEMVSVGLKHQSNGRGSVLGISRSWNRLYANFGFMSEDTEVYIRPWVRIFREDPDDNADIEDFMGYGDLQIIRHFNGNRLELTARLNPSTGKGMAELGYHFPLVGDLHGYFSIFSGYGESLIDYNHRQTAVTAGFSLFQF
ncbi:MAG: phospholipase A [Wenzhouxiangella sp.]